MSDVKHDLYLAYRGHGYNRSDSIDISNRFYDSVLDDAYRAVDDIHPYASMSNESPSMKESSLQAIEALKHDHQ